MQCLPTSLFEFYIYPFLSLRDAACFYAVEKRAASFMKKAAAAFEKGRQLEMQGLPMREAFVYFKKAATLGNRHAWVKMGYFYLRGWSTVRVYVNKAVLLLLAGHKAHVQAAVYGLVQLRQFASLREEIAGAQNCDALASFALDDICSRLTEIDRRARLSQIETDAANNDINSQVYLAVSLRNQKQYAACFKWLDRAANRGDVRAQTIMGIMYEQGEVVLDKQLAFHWYRKAAAQGHKQACGYLSQCYAGGIGTHSDLELAHFGRQLSL